MSSAYLKLLILLPAILIPAYASSSLAFQIMYSVFKLNKQGHNKQPWCTHFPILIQFAVPCPILSIASLPAYRFLRRQVRWSGIPFSLRIFHSLLWSTQSKPLAYQWSRSRCFSGIFLLFLWSNGYWQYDLWFLCIFYIQLEHLKFLGEEDVWQVAKYHLGFESKILIIK